MTDDGILNLNKLLGKDFSEDVSIKRVKYNNVILGLNFGKFYEYTVESPRETPSL